ncbi:MAG: exodeoxyribonuclease VII large subunit [Clostridiales bacterium]|nr:exodeoxyribonuclease VII large subunit [Clostridiales bacterium]
MEQRPVFTVSQVNNYIKGLLDRDGPLSGLFIRGEISNYKTYPSGHHYFSLKDPEGALRCVMFRREAASLRFRPQNGMKVVAFGRVTVFPRDGQYQLYCTRIAPDGVGELHIAFQQLKEKLLREGLFDKDRKRPLPPFPTRIVLITSPAGAAVRDMLRVLRARWPLAKVLLLPVRVQGAEAPGELREALAYANDHHLGDLILLGRGGGSMEDLWAFNDEGVARAIYASRIPVISAVGHEPDVTIADFVADLRAATPSNGAELAVPDRRELADQLVHWGARVDRATRRRLEEARSRLARAADSRAMTGPQDHLRDKRLLLDYQSRRMAHGLSAVLGRERTRFERLAAALDALSPLKVLGRGYAIARTEQGRVLTSVRSVAAGDRFSLRLSDGELDCEMIAPKG